MKLDKQSVIDALCLIVGSAVGAAASAVFIFYAWVRKPVEGDPGVNSGELADGVHER